MTGEEIDEFVTRQHVLLSQYGETELEDIVDHGDGTDGKGAVFRVIVPILASHEHDWEVIEEKSILVICRICDKEGYK